METISAKFHIRWLKSSWRWRGEAVKKTSVLTRGCFQNRYLSERAIVPA